jgi:hypothetical protein
LGSKQVALVLSFKIGDDFYIGSERFIVESIPSPGQARVRRESDQQAFDISSTCKTEIERGVAVQVGSRISRFETRLCIDAPKGVLVLRGENYRNPPDRPNADRNEV